MVIQTSSVFYSQTYVCVYNLILYIYIYIYIYSSLGLFPGTTMSTIARTSLFSSILCMCPYQRSLISLTVSCMLFTPSSFLMSTLFTLSHSVTPLILLNILIYVFSRICSSFFLTVQHSAPYRSTGLMTVM